MDGITQMSTSELMIIHRQHALIAGQMWTMMDVLLKVVIGALNHAKLAGIENAMKAVNN